MRGKGFINYDTENERWVFENYTSHSYGLHCGEGFEIKIGENYFPCRLELATDWYIILDNVSFALMPRKTYEVKCI